MTIEKRSIVKIFLLNCVTLGIYGAVTCQKLGNEIDYLFDGDGEEPALGYMGTVFNLVLSAIASICYMAGSMSLSIPVIVFGVLCNLGVPFFTIYRRYWWYRQASRIKLNAWRYNLTVRERGVDTILLRTVGEIPMIMATAVFFFAHLLVPALICGLAYLISYNTMLVILALVCIPLALFLPDCTAGAYVSLYFIIKNINRFADAAESGNAFDPMAYEYDPSLQDCYLNFVPELIERHPEQPPIGPAILEAVRGSNKGYRFELMPGEEVIIGRNPMEANVVIDASYDQVSGRHVGVQYDAEFDKFYVIDYSKNGTYVDGQKLTAGRQYRFDRGARIELVDGRNAFRLK